LLRCLNIGTIVLIAIRENVFAEMSITMDKTKKAFLKHMSESYDKLFEKTQGIYPYKINVELVALMDCYCPNHAFISSSNFNVQEKCGTFDSFCLRKVI